MPIETDIYTTTVYFDECQCYYRSLLLNCYFLAVAFVSNVASHPPNAFPSRSSSISTESSFGSYIVIKSNVLLRWASVCFGLDLRLKGVDGCFIYAVFRSCFSLEIFCTFSFSKLGEDRFLVSGIFYVWNFETGLWQHSECFEVEESICLGKW